MKKMPTGIRINIEDEEARLIARALRYIVPLARQRVPRAFDGLDAIEHAFALIKTGSDLSDELRDYLIGWGRG